MTKALTRGAKRRLKRGRTPDDMAARYPSGRKKPSSRSSAALEAKERAILADLRTAARRCERAGWPDTAENKRIAAGDWRFGTLPGVLNAAKGSDGRPRLSTRALAGLMEYAVAREAWRKAEGFPSEWPGIASYCDVRGGTSRDPFEPSYVIWIAGLHAKYLNAARVLANSGRKGYVYDAFMAGEDVKSSDVAEWIVRELDAAGETLAFHFGL